MILVRDVKSDGDKPVTLPPPLSRTFEDDRPGLVARLCHEEIQPPLLSVRPEGREVRLAGPQEEKGEDKFEGEVLDANYPHHLQVEKKPSSSSQVVRQESVVDVDQDNEEEGLVQSDHIVISSPRDGQFPLLPMHSNGHCETKHQSTGFHTQVSISYRVRVLKGEIIISISRCRDFIIKLLILPQ